MSNNFDILEALWLRREKKRRAQKTIDGAPPLTYTAKNAGTLKNYRIYGNTVNSESVGDRTANLFDAEIEQGALQGTDGTAVDSPRRVRSTGIQLSGGDYTISATGCDNIILLVYSTAADYILRESKTSFQNLPFSFSLEGDRIVKFALKKFDDSSLTPSDVSNIMLNSGSTALPYEPYGYKVPVTVEGKNLLQNTATSRTIGELTLTVNTDGSVTCNGRREQTSTFFTIGSVTTSGEIILSGCPSGGSSASFAMRAFSATVSNPRIYYDIGDSCMLNTPDTYNIDIRIQSNYACDNLTFYPMIRKADITDDTYEPYQPPVTTPIYLPEQIRKVGDEAEYIDYAEHKQHFADGTFADVTLPALPTIAGTNTLSVGTQVQPSKVMVKGKLKE